MLEESARLAIARDVNIETPTIEIFLHLIISAFISSATQCREAKGQPVRWLNGFLPTADYMTLVSRRTPIVAMTCLLVLRSTGSAGA